MQGITSNNHSDISQSQQSFNNLLSNAIQQGQSLMSRKQIIEDYVDAQKSHLEASANKQTFEQSVEDIIAQNCAQDLTQLNFDVVGTVRGSGAKQNAGYQEQETLYGEENTQQFDQNPEPHPYHEDQQDDTVFDYNQDLGRSQEWTQTHHTISNLSQKQEELQVSRLEVSGKGISPIVTPNTISRQKQNNLQTVKSHLNTRELEYALETPLKGVDFSNTTKLTRGPGEALPIVNSQNLINRYHTLRQQEVSIKRNTLKFAENRINPPKCLLDVLDALFSLLFGVYNKLDTNYFTIQHKKYYVYKGYLSDLNQLCDVVANFKLYIETQGIPAKNISEASIALERYYRSVKLIDTDNYIKNTNEIAKYIAYFIEYYNILKELNMEPLSKTNGQNAISGIQTLKNSTRQDWRDQVYEAPLDDAKFSEAELINLVKTTVKQKVFFIIRGINDPPASILHSVKSLHALFGGFISEPGYKMRFVWPWYQSLLKDIIPQLVNDLPALLKEGKISADSIQAAETYLSEFGSCMKTRRELNDSFNMQYATKIMNLILYAGKLWRFYNPGVLDQ